MGLDALAMWRFILHVQRMRKSIEQRPLTFEDALFCLGEGEPCATVHFGAFDHAAGAGGPLHLAEIADQLCRIEIALEGPCGDKLAARLFYRPEFDECALRREGGFFLKFAFRRGEGL